MTKSRLKALRNSKYDPNDSDNLKEYSRTVDGKKLYRMPEGNYKNINGRYIKQKDNS